MQIQAYLVLCFFGIALKYKDWFWFKSEGTRAKQKKEKVT